MWRMESASGRRLARSLLGAVVTPSHTTSTARGISGVATHIAMASSFRACVLRCRTRHRPTSRATRSSGPAACGPGRRSSSRTRRHRSMPAHWRQPWWLRAPDEAVAGGHQPVDRRESGSRRVCRRRAGRIRPRTVGGAVERGAARLAESIAGSEEAPHAGTTRIGAAVARHSSHQRPRAHGVRPVDTANPLAAVLTVLGGRPPGGLEGTRGGRPRWPASLRPRPRRLSPDDSTASEARSEHPDASRSPGRTGRARRARTPGPRVEGARSPVRRRPASASSRARCPLAAVQARLVGAMAPSASSAPSRSPSARRGAPGRTGRARCRPRRARAQVAYSERADVDVPGSFARDRQRQLRRQLARDLAVHRVERTDARRRGPRLRGRRAGEPHRPPVPGVRRRGSHRSRSFGPIGGSAPGERGVRVGDADHGGRLWRLGQRRQPLGRIGRPSPPAIQGVIGSSGSGRRRGSSDHSIWSVADDRRLEQRGRRGAERTDRRVDRDLAQDAEELFTELVGRLEPVLRLGRRSLQQQPVQRVVLGEHRDAAWSGRECSYWVWKPLNSKMSTARVRAIV